MGAYRPYKDENFCIFEGIVDSIPILREDDRNTLEIIIRNDENVIIHLRAYRQYALVLYAQISAFDKVHVECFYSPAKILGTDVFGGRFIINKLIFMEKKIPEMKLSFELDKC